MQISRAKTPKKKRYGHVKVRSKRDERVLALLRGLYDDRFLDMDSGEVYEADDEEYEDLEEEFASEMSGEI